MTVEKVTKLKLAEASAPSEDLVMEKFNSKAEEIRNYLAENKGRKVGFAMIGYCRENKGCASTFATYFLDDPLDGYILPEMARARLEALRDDQGEDED